MSPEGGVVPHDLTSGDWIVFTIAGQDAGGRYDGLSVDADGRICMDYLAGADASVPRSLYLADADRLEVIDETRARALSVLDESARPIRSLTPQDEVTLTVHGPSGADAGVGGDQTSMTVYQDGLVCFEYRLDVDEGFGMSSYVGWITEITLDGPVSADRR
ncbi:hypothetical protein [Baekduia sp. Peel2402]|uniref:hypothetical protein n=1 Tax=Baekduia sp. Peel2402 TaxID=3458296 RepID=UPI00403E6294